MTLTGAVITGDSNKGAGIYSALTDGLTIKLVGNSTVTGRYASGAYAQSIYTENNLTFEGDGAVTLGVDSTVADKAHCGIFSLGTITVTVNGGTVTTDISSENN